MSDMLPELNPYVPGSGLRPPLLAGRDDEIAAFDLLVARTRGLKPARGIVLHGLRGVGKTVLLRQFMSQADRAGWLIVDLEASTTESGVQAARNRLARGLATAAHKFSRVAAAKGALSDALSTIASFTVSLGVGPVNLGVTANPTRANSGRLDVDLEELVDDLGPVLRENSTALGIFIDELQDLDPELLSALLAVQHRAGQNGTPFFLIGAGLPSVPGIVSAARSYSERLFDYRELGPLAPDRAALAVRSPAERLQIPFSDEAVTAIVTAAEGYPYFLQLFAMKAWDKAYGKSIGLEDAILGIEDGQLELDMGFYPARWDRATPSERRYLIAMATESTGTMTTASLSSLLGVSHQALSTVRQRLIDKGMIYAPERGVVAFTVPGMTAFIRRQPEALADL